MQKQERQSSSTSTYLEMPAIPTDSQQVPDGERNRGGIISPNSILEDAGLLGKPEDILRNFGFQKLRRWRRYSARILLTITTLLIALIIGIHISNENSRLPEVLTAVAALATILLAYSQWRESRQEASFEKYYERQEITNRRMEREGERAEKIREEKANGEADEKADLDAGWESLFNMLVFAEMDNLEYVSEKYKLGYIKPELACRALRHFYARCIDKHRGKKFRDRAAQWIEVISYEETTRTIVGRIITKADKPFQT